MGTPNTHCDGVVERRREDLAVPSPASSSPPSPSRLSRKSKSPLAASVALVSTTVSSRSNRSSRSSGARSSGTAESCTFWLLAPRARSSAPSAVRRGAGRSVRLRPSEMASSRRNAPRSSWSSWPRRSVSSAWASRSAIVSTASRSARNAVSVASSSNARPSSQIAIDREVVAQAKLTRRAPRRAARTAGRTSRRSPVGRRPAPGTGARRRSSSARPAQQVACGPQARGSSVGARPRPLRSKRASSRRTMRLVTCTPRWLAATSSRWCASSSTSRL